MGMLNLRGALSNLVRPKAAPAAIDARDYYESMICSADDDTGPSRRLLDLSLQVIKLAADVDLQTLAQERNAPEWFTVWPGEHYRLLSAFMLALKPKTVIEIGTFAGLSALAMKSYLGPDGRLVTFDLQPWNSIPERVLTFEDFADGRLVQHLDNLADEQTFERHRDLLESADFLFIDGPKDGVTEYVWMKRFQTLRFKNAPILLFDDIRLMSMVPFWRTLKHPKLDLTSFGHWSGTGIVEWQTPSPS
jgi:predicted O-methyltransferase YrrM